MPKVLISDKLDRAALEIFEKKGVDADFKPDLNEKELLAIIPEYDGLAVRSATKVTEDVLAVAQKLKVIGRAGIGIDNIDLARATEAGVIVMNTPFGNSITTAEHAIAMMFALARQIPAANASTHKGRWEKKKFMGTELYNKTLGVIGCGNIGSIVADRAQGLKMHVIAYDPFLSEERAVELGVEKTGLDDLYARADFITIHVPKNEKTAGLVDKESFMKMKEGARIINCARGGIINEADLAEALDSGKIAGAALDVFAVEPAADSPLFGRSDVVCTPHLGAATTEAQVNVAMQIAEQMSDYLISGAITNALNMPSISAEDAPRLKPYMKLVEQLGRFVGQISEQAIEKIEIEYQGTIAEMNTKPLSALVMANLLGAQLDSVNMVNALSVAESRGIQISETHSGSSQDWRSIINVTVTAGGKDRNVTGTLFTGKEPRIVNIETVPIEAALSENMLFIRNEDTPGLVGNVGTILGDSRVNIANFHLGRKKGRNTAICLVSLDQPLPDGVFENIAALPQIRHIKRLSF